MSRWGNSLSMPPGCKQFGLAYIVQSPLTGSLARSFGLYT